MSDVLTVCVFCGSQFGRDPRWANAAEQLGQGIGKAGHRLVYGGGKIGLMGVLADAALAQGSQIIGVLPEFLNQRELAHKGINEMVVTKNMHERKKYMYELADACVSLPGGLGTLDESVEMITWKSLDQHNKPLILIDIDGFWRPFIELLRHMEKHGFLHQPLDQLLHISPNIEDVLPSISRLQAAHAQPHQLNNL